MKSHPSMFSVWLMCAFGNLFYQWLPGVPMDYSQAFERSFFQAVFVLTYWLMCKVESKIS